MDATDNEAFGAPFNWCDRRCERCPLSGGCPLYRRTEQRRWVHEARGEDPDDMRVVLADVEEELTRTLRMLREIAEEEGVDPDAPAPAPPTALDSVRLHKAWLALIRALNDGLQAAGRAAPAQARAAEEAIALGTILTMKSARLGGYLAGGRDEAWAMDAVPNLLLMERLRARLDEVLAEAGELLEEDAQATLRRALAQIDRILRPLIDSAGAEPRALLERLIARRAAPSPFCVVEP
jgi:hypothetical protein